MSRPKRRAANRRRALIALAIVVLILAGGAGASVFAYSAIKGQANQLQTEITVHLQAGQSELEAAKASLKAANSTHDQALIAKASVHFTTAKVQFMVSRQIADSSQLLQRLESLPAVGELARSRLVAVDGIADMGVAISDAGLELASLDGQLIKPDTSGGQQGRTLLTVLNQTHTSVVKVRSDLARAQKSAALVDVHVLPAGQQTTFAKARGTIDAALGAIDEFESLVPMMTEVLGGNGARNYLIEQVNPAELRPGGGFIGTYSVLRADHGALNLVRTGDAYSISDPRAAVGKPGYVAPPGPLRESLSATTSWSFVDSNFFPDFTSNAKAAETFAQPRLGMNVDGVIAIDYYTVAKLLELTGPMAVPGYGVTVNSTNFIPLVIQYDLNTADVAHKGLVGAIAGPLLQRVSTLPPDRWPALIGSLNDLAAARHFQAYFNSDTVQKQVNLFGWSADLSVAGAKDYMMEVEANLGATKANYFLTRHFTLELTRKGGSLHHKLTIDLLDDMPYAYRPTEFYYPYIRLYISANASGGSTNLRRVKYPNPAPPVGTVMMDGWVPLFHGYGHTAQALYEWDTPWQANGRGEDRIYWQKQPGTITDKFDIIWHDGIGHTYKAAGDLAQDRVLTFSTKGILVTAGPPPQAQLPSLSLG